MNRLSIATLRERVTDRDLEILQDVEAFRLLTTQHIQRLHFHAGHDSVSAAARACNRVLARLRGLDLVRSLSRRVGGIRRGSAGYVWHLGPSGDRLLRQLHGDPVRRRFTEPSTRFTDHTLAVAELGVGLRHAAQQGLVDLPLLRTEPACWRSSLNRHGVAEQLKPDLHAVTATGQFEDHWFIEMDTGSEHAPVVLGQCHAYQRFALTGRYQAEHAVFPTVLWVVPHDARAAALKASIADDLQLDEDFFRFVTTDDALRLITGAAPSQPTNGASAGD